MDIFINLMLPENISIYIRLSDIVSILPCHEDVIYSGFTISGEMRDVRTKVITTSSGILYFRESPDEIYHAIATQMDPERKV